MIPTMIYLAIGFAYSVWWVSDFMWREVYPSRLEACIAVLFGILLPWIAIPLDYVDGYHKDFWGFE